MAIRASNRNLAAGLGFAAVTALIIGGALIDQRANEGSQGAGLVPRPIFSGVCGGVSVAPDLIGSSSAFALVMPSHALASEETLAQAWDCSETEIAFEFQSGVVVYQSVNTLEDPEAEWKSMAEAYPEFSVGEINGISASFIDPSVGNGTAEGGVDFVQGEVRIFVSGNGEIPLADLVSVAESLRDWPSLSQTTGDR